MAELSIEEKAKAYDEAIEQAEKELTVCRDMNCDAARQIFRLFPQLAESEDERIRRRLIQYFSDFRLGTFAGIEPKKIIDWLNKQGKKSTKEREFLEEVGLSDYPEEYRLAWLKENCNMQHLQPKQECGDEPALKPKFHKGDLIVNNHNGWVCQVTEIRDDEYCIWPLYCEMKGYSRITDVDDDYHLWTIADAKDGDALTFKNNIGGIILCKSPTDYDTGSYCRLMDYNFINKEESGWDSRLLIPAPKEGRDLLFQKIHAEGYEWDAEKKKLKKIEDELIADVEIPFGAKDSELEEVFYSIPNGFHAEIKDDKVVIKKGEQKSWSEEDRKNYQMLQKIICDSDITANLANKLSDWLKSLRPQKSWKPSDEQMQVLVWCRPLFVDPKSKGILDSLINDLKKLREE